MLPALRNQILERLLDDEALDGAVVNLVDAACEGEAKLNSVLAEVQDVGSEVKRTTVRPAAATPQAAFVKTIEVAGFRGVGPARKIELAPGPGFTLILGRNGSGKSSFSEGLETLLTGQSRRWLSRPKDWLHGWKNLHTDDGAFIEATFDVEGSEPVTLRRVWKEDVDLDDGELRVRRGAERLDGLHALGWEEPLRTFRPFLSYSELGALLNEPSKLYDELKSILGLEDVTKAAGRLASARKERDARKKTAKEKLAPLLETLKGTADPRAAACAKALVGRKWDLDKVACALAGDADGDDAAHVVLRQLASLRGPDLDAVQQAVSACRAAVSAAAEVAGSSEAQSAELAKLLEVALSFHERFDGECPVCERTLGKEWTSRAQERLLESKERAGAVREATAAVRSSAQVLRRMITSAPASLTADPHKALCGDVLTAWTRWSSAPEEPGALCDHAEEVAVDLVAAVESLRAEVRSRLEKLESAWRPIAIELAAWLQLGRVVVAEAEALGALKKAEKWMTDAESALRDDRFAPIATRSQEIWALLRQQSSVDLADVKLEGKGTRRKVALNVSVDGQEGVAVSVMSQGELNALALSLFLPRMTLAESPFRFVVVDDPVQAMDPHKVDGLARVLEEVARTRQVIVLTHDTRLFEAIRRLGIEATVIEVGRRARSVVEMTGALDPVERHLQDAWHCLQHEHKLGSEIARRTIPGFCRLALEAACTEAVRRRRLARGDSHTEVEQSIEQARGLQNLAALAITDDAEQGDKVYRFLNKKHGDWAGDAFKQIKQSAHSGYAGSLKDLLDCSRQIARTLRDVR